MNEEKKKSDIERAADERREELENPEKAGRPDPNAGAFNPVEGVPPHGASIPEKED